MTKNERKALQDFMNKTKEFSAERDEAFHALQELSRKHGLSIYCCAKSNMEQLQNTSDKDLAMTLYEKYVESCGKYDLITEYGCMLAELNFWKKS